MAQFHCPEGHTVTVKSRDKRLGSYHPDDLVCTEHGKPLLSGMQLRARSKTTPTPPSNQLSSPTRGRLKRSQPKRDWSDARTKCELEGRCRVCGDEGRVEAAHIMGRRYDEPDEARPSVLYVRPERIVPLCPADHSAFDAHELDLLGHLAIEEQVRAVIDAGSLESARVRLAPNAYREAI